MEELVSYLVKNLVEKPEDVKVSTKKEDEVVIIYVSTHPDDIGKVIGRNGKVAQSLRTIVKNIGLKSKQKVVLKIGE